MNAQIDLNVDFITHAKHEILSALELIFVKWWQVGTGLIATWITALFGHSILLFITPELAKSWIPIVGSLLVLLITLIFLFRKKNKELKHMEEKHTQEMRQDQMDKNLELYDRALKNGTIKEGTTIADFIQQIEKITTAFGQ